MENASAIIAKVKEIPLLSPCAHHLITLVGDSEHTINDVRAIIDTDPGLTASILRAVNSAAMGLVEPITTTARAVAYLGDKVVLGIALGSCAAQLYDDPLEGYEAERGSLWCHCLQTAIAAREIALLAKLEASPDEAYTAGLLHDIGKPLISAAMIDKPHYPLGNISYIEWERSTLGTDHCEVSALIAQHWGLPESLQAVMAYHHTPAECPESYRSIVYAVHLGDMISMLEGAGTGCDTLQYTLDNRYVDYFELSETQLERIVINVQDGFHRTASALDALGHKVNK